MSATITYLFSNGVSSTAVVPESWGLPSLTKTPPWTLVCFLPTRAHTQTDKRSEGEEVLDFTTNGGCCGGALGLRRRRRRLGCAGHRPLRLLRLGRLLHHRFPARPSPEGSSSSSSCYTTSEHY